MSDVSPESLSDRVQEAALRLAEVIVREFTG